MVPRSGLRPRHLTCLAPWHLRHNFITLLSISDVNEARTHEAEAEAEAKTHEAEAKAEVRTHEAEVEAEARTHEAEAEAWIYIVDSM